MSKSDYPALRMKVDRGRLVPAGPFDQERLNSYRNGAVIMCRFTEEKDRVLVKKWFAIIGLVLKQCQTPWKNKDEAHEAIKLALGIVNLSKTVGGDFMSYPKSLSELDDPEMTEALESMTELLSRMTGVDVATLKKETAHIVEQEDHDPHTGEIIEHESGASPSPDADEPAVLNSSASTEEAAPSSSVDSHTDASDTEGGPASEVSETADGQSRQVPTSAVSRDAETETLIQFAKDMLTTAAAQGSSLEAVKAVEAEYVPHIRLLSAAGVSRARSISSSARAILEGSTSLESAVEFFSKQLGCRPDEIGG